MNPSSINVSHYTRTSWLHEHGFIQYFIADLKKNCWGKTKQNDKAEQKTKNQIENISDEKDGLYLVLW